MSLCLLADRGVLIQLAMPSQLTSTTVETWLSKFDVVAVETGGASALRSVLSRKPAIQNKLYVVDHDDYLAATKFGFHHVEMLVAQALADPATQGEIRRYKTSRQQLAEGSEDLIKYVWKLFFLAYAMNASLLVADYRIGLLCAVLESCGAVLTRLDGDGFISYSLRESCRLFDDCAIEPRSIEVFAMPEAASDPLSTKERRLSGFHVFISYCHENTAEVQRLHDDLTAQGIKLWWDKDILPGQDWKLEINKALKSARGVLLCLSTEAVSRRQSGLFPEALDAISRYREHQPGATFIVPVRLSACDIPVFPIDGVRSLDALQYVNLFPETKRADGVARIIKALSAIL